MTLTCPSCGGRWFKRPEGTCTDCGFAGKPMMMSDAAREAICKRHKQAIQAKTLPPGYDQVQHDRILKDLFGW